MILYNYAVHKTEAYCMAKNQMRLYVIELRISIDDERMGNECTIQHILVSPL